MTDTRRTPEEIEEFLRVKVQPYGYGCLASGEVWFRRYEQDVRSLLAEVASLRRQNEDRND